MKKLLVFIFVSAFLACEKEPVEIQELYTGSALKSISNPMEPGEHDFLDDYNNLDALTIPVGIGIWGRADNIGCDYSR